MKQEEKENYVESWNEHISSINTLGMNPDIYLSKRVFYLVKELKAIVPKIADAKIKATEEEVISNV